MTRREWWRRQLRITWHLPLVLAILGAAGLVAGNWNRLTSSRPRVVRLAGSHPQAW